ARPLHEVAQHLLKDKLGLIFKPLLPETSVKSRRPRLHVMTDISAGIYVQMHAHTHTHTRTHPRTAGPPTDSLEEILSFPRWSGV
ncbi:hypothetical protein ACTXT7_017564, partial [Hymenolepis weldensis]